MSEFIIECDYDPDDGWIPGEYREQIVRCRDCAFSRIHDGKRYPGKKAKGRMYCINWGEMLNDWTKPDGFCHRAKRKEVSK